MAEVKKNPFYTKLIISLILCVGGGWISGLVTEHGLQNWYPMLAKPSGLPPNIVFPIVWTILYIMMGFALALFWSTKAKKKGLGYLFFFVQLAANFVWSFLFFYLENPLLGLTDIILMIILVVLTIIEFSKVTKLGSYFLYPYLLWLVYATYLNLFIWIKN